MHMVAQRKSMCCPAFDNLPHNIQCFLPDIDKKWNRLTQRHCNRFIHRKRVLRLAEPRAPATQRYIRKCPCKFQNPVEIVREQPANTRTEHLALPPIRRLLLFKERVRDLFEPLRIVELNRLIRKSLFSVYTRLHNGQPPEKPVPTPKWSEEEWKKHTAYLKKLAKPKKAPRKPKLPVKRMPLENMKLFKKLAIPKIRLEPVKEPWTLTPAAKNYEATERIREMATAKPKDDSAMVQELPIPIPPSALHYKATKRTKDLATPREKGAGESDLKENPYSIAPNALKARATPRLKELAEPKEYEDQHTRDIPWPISPAALKAKATPRIIALAQPKGS